MILTDGVVIVNDFFSPAALYDLHSGAYTVIKEHDERSAGLVSRVKTEMCCRIVNAELEAFIKSDDLAELIGDVPDAAWRNVWNQLLSPDNYSAISRYTPGSEMKWHCDHWDGQVLNWIVSLHGDGYIRWCQDKFPKALPEIFQPSQIPSAVDLAENRLILMPAYYPHHITIGNEERISIHGHFKL